MRLRPTRPFLFLALIAGALAGGCAGDDDTKVKRVTAPTGFLFANDAPSAYLRVDRMGMPAVATAVITSKDGYNAADPVDDAAGDFVTEITNNIDAIHTGLDAALGGAGLTPCLTADCVAQAAPFVVPDTLKIDTTGPAGFPNGRVLPDPVMDITLALVLLDLGAHGVGDLAALPLNPPANDVAFGATFPYLAAPHVP